MSGPGQPNPWTWSPDHNDYYRAVRLANGQWDYIFANDERSSTSVTDSQRVPRNPRGGGEDEEEVEQPLEPYGFQSSSNYSYGTPSTVATVDDVMPRLANLSVSRGAHRDRRRGHADEEVATSSRSAQRPSNQGRHKSESNAQQDIPAAQPQYSYPSYQGAYGRGTAQQITYATVPTMGSSSAVYASQPLSGSGNGKGKQAVPGYANQAGYSTSQYSPSSNPATASGQQTSNVDANDTETAGSLSILRGTPGSYEPLDPSFKQVVDHWKFFVPGRVFATLWVEPAGGELGPSVKKYGDDGYRKVRRFIVVRAKPRNFYSKCIPISTHGGRATTKPGLNQIEHTIVYTGATAPSRLAGENKLRKDAIQVIPVNQTEKLDPLSRANLAKTYPVEHNLKVKEVGKVSDKDLKKLIGYWKDLSNA